VLQFTGTLALVVATLALVAAGCGKLGGHSAATSAAGTPTTLAPCKVDRAQRRTVARALADIRRRAGRSRQRAKARALELTVRACAVQA
jgi:hypothetical protein